jgi:hypothetical protein
MKKDSPLTPFVAHAIKKMAETGVKNNLSKRHGVISEPNCKPIRTKGRSLGMPFFLALFVAYFSCCIICLIIFILEYAFKPEKSKMILKPTSNILKKELDKKIEDLIKHIETEDMDAIILKRKTICLLDEIRAYIICQNIPNK